MTTSLPLLRAAEQVYRAIADEGPRPDVHHAAIRDLRERWPVLAAAVQALVLAYAQQLKPRTATETLLERQHRWLRGPEIQSWSVNAHDEMERLLLTTHRQDGMTIAHLFEVIQTPNIHGVHYRRFRTDGPDGPLELPPGQSPDERRPEGEPRG